MFYEEDGVIIEQKDTFNNETGEARLSVPAHGNNSAIDVILQEGSMVTSSNDFCQLSDVPENIETGSMETNADSVVNSTADTTISKDVENVKYGLKINEGELTQEESDSLSPSMKEACGGKTIVKMTVEETNEDNFNEMAAGGIVTIPQTRSSLSRVRRQTNTNCTNITVRYEIIVQPLLFPLPETLHLQRQELLAVALLDQLHIYSPPAAEHSLCELL